MKRVYSDTSALIKEFVPEVGSDLIDKLTTAARENKLEIISSVWAINETIAVIDRKQRKGELTKVEIQRIIATFVNRYLNNKENFFFVSIQSEMVANSRILINEFHISADDALHLYTGYIYDCSYFLIHDNKIIDRILSRVAEDMRTINLADETNRRYLESELSL